MNKKIEMHKCLNCGKKAMILAEKYSGECSDFEFWHVHREVPEFVREYHCTKCGAVMVLANWREEDLEKDTQDDFDSPGSPGVWHCLRGIEAMLGLNDEEE